MGVENEINAISAFNQVVVEVEAELGNSNWSRLAVQIQSHIISRLEKNQDMLNNFIF